VNRAERRRIEAAADRYGLPSMAAVEQEVATNPVFAGGVASIVVIAGRYFPLPANPHYAPNAPAPRPALPAPISLEGLFDED
jgi:hypothetical protein